jgi:DNA-binding NarL/FixJ family response regulator
MHLGNDFMTLIKSRQGRRKPMRKPTPALRLTHGWNDASASNSQSQAQQRAAIVSFCKAIGEQFADPRLVSQPPVQSPKFDARLQGLPPRVQETLGRLLAGDSEKEIGVHMGVSRNTVHVYVKVLYRHFEVNSRGELLARFVKSPLS